MTLYIVRTHCSKTITANINVLNGTVKLSIPSIMGDIANSFPIQTQLQSDYRFPSDISQDLSFLCVVRSSDSLVSNIAVINLSIGSGVITISAGVNNEDFQVGSINEWGMIYPVTLTYNLA